MKALAFALIAVAPLGACSVEEAADNQEQAGAENVVETAEADQARPSPEAQAGGKSAQTGGDAAARGAPPAEDADQCGASRYQWLVGQPRSAIPSEPAGARWRVTCTGCPITMDYNPARLNIFYDAETERVEEVRCG